MGEAINLVENFKVEKVIFNCGEFNELEKELIKALDKKKIPYYSCVEELNIDDNKEIERILRALYLYEEQLERQAFELNGSENKGQKDKLFYLNINKKIDLIKPQLREIINYFVYNANELVWEEKPGKDILRISDAVYSHFYQNVHDRDRIAYLLGNYVSLEEAKKGLVKTKAIDRFILR